MATGMLNVKVQMTKMVSTRMFKWKNGSILESMSGKFFTEIKKTVNEY